MIKYTTKDDPKEVARNFGSAYGGKFSDKVYEGYKRMLGLTKISAQQVRDVEGREPTAKELIWCMELNMEMVEMEKEGNGRDREINSG